MNSIRHHTNDEIRLMLNRFDEVSNKDNTSVDWQSTSIELKCNCGCVKVEHFNVPVNTLCKRYFIRLCPKHEIKLNHATTKQI